MSWLEHQWHRRTPGAALLLPLAALFGLVSSIRRSLYRHGIFKRQRLGVSVIVVGNIMAGGTGKTPLVLWLCAWLQSHGYRPGIVTRGYGGTAHEAAPVHADSDPALYGDEAVLLAARSGCPVWAGHNRAAAGRALLAAHPECDVVISDDGLQHYALERDIEIAVVDAARGHGNGWLLPAGPLREPVSRLRSVDAVVVHGSPLPEGCADVASYGMHLVGRSFYNLLNRERRAGAEYFEHKSVHAIAGIGHPQRFFRHLQQLGMTFFAHPYPDHYAYQPADLAYGNADAIVMTEKDAVKCRRFASERCWVLPVDAEVDPELGALVLRQLETL
jgi:tetraacyldisaccharide 4'-kinase